MSKKIDKKHFLFVQFPPGMHIPSKVKLKWQPCKNLTFFFTFQNCFWCPRIIMSQHAYHKNHNSTRLTQCAESCEVCNKKLIIKNWPQSLFDAMHVSTNTKRYTLPWTVKLSNLSCWSFKTKKTKVSTRYGRKYDDGQKMLHMIHRVIPSNNHKPSSGHYTTSYMRQKASKIALMAVIAK